MAFITSDYSNNGGKFKPLPAGTYELIIKDARMGATQGGSEFIGLTMVVRNDLKNVPDLASTNGKYANRLLFHNEFKRLDEKTDKRAYSQSNLQNLLEAVGFPEGQALNTMEDFLNALKGKPVNANVELKYSEYHNENRNSIKPWEIKPTKFPQVAHVWKDNSKAAQGPLDTPNSKPIETGDDDLPF